MLYKLFIPVVLIVSQIISHGQEGRKTPRNFAGFSFVIDGANLSVARGIEYERQFYAGNNFLAGVRGNYYQKYRSGNADFSFNSWASSYNGNYKISLSQLWATGYFFVSQKARHRGFFLSTALGLTRSVATKIEGGGSGNSRYDNMMGGAELGTGLQLPLGKKLDFRGIFTLSVSGSQDYPGNESSPHVLLCTKLCIGF
jgi:hypothetical protein